MKFLVPLLIALLGLGAGVGAGLWLKPAPEPAETACAEEDEACAAANPFQRVAAPATPQNVVYVPMDKQFVVPVFSNERVGAMVVMSLSIETSPEAEATVRAVQARLRDSFLAVMFRHANTGGFDGAYTTGQKIEDLRASLLQASRSVLPGTPVSAIMITEIARQDT